MTKELIKETFVFENPDILKSKYLNVYDGTGRIIKKANGNADFTCELNGKYYYTPFVGTVFTAQFPELTGLNNHLITDENIIKKIAKNII